MTGKWEENSKYVLESLDDIKSSCQNTIIELQAMKLEIAKLKFQASVWGLMAGGIPIILLLAIDYLKSRYGG